MEIKLLRPFEFAQRLAALSEFETRFRMSAVIVRKGRVLGVGINKLKTAGAKYPKLFSIHAELAAIINSKPFKTDLAGTDIYVYRQTVDGLPGMALPCDTCLGAIKEARIARVFYSINVEPYYDWVEI